MVERGEREKIGASMSRKGKIGIGKEVSTGCETLYSSPPLSPP